MIIYEVVFAGQKMTIEADSVVYLGTKASFYKGGDLVAYFDIPHGTPFGYVVKKDERNNDGLQ